MPPYSAGRCGAHSPADRTASRTSSRAAAARASASGSLVPRRRGHSSASRGRISSLTIAAVRRRPSLTWSGSAATGETWIGMGQFLPTPRRGPRRALRRMPPSPRRSAMPVQFEAALAELTAPGQLFETAPRTLGGVDYPRAFVNAPATLKEIFARARGVEATFLVYEDEEWTFAEVMA